jgi:hypothetical protein
MQTLGLSSESKRSDGVLKSIFWPTVENAWDVDYLGRQGLTICTVVAVFEMVVSLLPGNGLILIFGAAAALIFLMGGIGVRESSWPAAAMVFCIYVGGILTVMAQGRPPSILAILVAGLLLTNARATILAALWKPAGPDEDKPTRFDETLMDQLTDQLPAKTWPVLRYFFYFFASIYLLFLFAGLLLFALSRYGLIRLPHS